MDAPAAPSGEPKPTKDTLEDLYYQFGGDLEEPEDRYTGAVWPAGGLSTDHPPTTGTALDSNVCILSLVNHYYDVYPMRRQCSNDQSKHLRLCETIALFHIAEAAGDVAAVSLVLSTDEIKFLVAKNRPCTAAKWA